MNQIESRKIFLIGMPGSGKSTLGKSLANKLSLPFYDLDQLIETITNSSISELFKEIKETGFRKLEIDILISFIKNNNYPFIMATGGGTVISDQSLSLINQTGISIYIKCKSSTLIARLSNTSNSRPLLQQNSLEFVIPKLLEQREVHYLKAHITQPADGTLDEIINELVNKL